MEQLRTAGQLWEKLLHISGGALLRSVGLTCSRLDGDGADVGRFSRKIMCRLWLVLFAFGLRGLPWQS